MKDKIQNKPHTHTVNNNDTMRGMPMAKSHPQTTTANIPRYSVHLDNNPSKQSRLGHLLPKMTAGARLTST